MAEKVTHANFPDKIAEAGTLLEDLAYYAFDSNDRDAGGFFAALHQALWSYTRARNIRLGPKPHFGFS